jgi:hypothetical protein
VIIGENQSFFSIDDDTGAGRLYLTIGGKIACVDGPSQALARNLFSSGAASNGNRDHGGFYLIEKRSERGHAGHLLGGQPNARISRNVAGRHREA